MGILIPVLVILSLVFIFEILPVMLLNAKVPKFKVGDIIIDQNKARYRVIGLDKDKYNLLWIEGNIDVSLYKRGVEQVFKKDESVVLPVFKGSTEETGLKP